MEETTRVIVNLQAISHNIKEIANRIGRRCKLMAVVKADGYGHGAVEVARTALASGASCLGVSVVKEGQKLREAGFRVPILVLGLIQPTETRIVVKFDLAQTVMEMNTVEALDAAAYQEKKKATIHVKIDTGMGRIGLKPEDTPSFIQKVLKCKNIYLEGISSHLATADEGDRSYTNSQICIFNDVIKELKKIGINNLITHIANSDAVLNYPETYYDMVRPGHMIYGLYPDAARKVGVSLQPAMSFMTKVVAAKWIPSGTSISYGRNFAAKKEMKVATLPLGYADGYSRLLTNRSEIIVHGKRAPAIGNVCMNAFMVDVSNIEGVEPGDDVILFGEGLPVGEIARNVGTIPQEIVSIVGKINQRVYINEMNSIAQMKDH